MLGLDTNRTRLVRKSKPSESFFNFFNPPIPPPEDDDDEVDAEDLDELEMKLEVDYQIGEDIKEKARTSRAVMSAGYLPVSCR
jgi:nucleosome assembly protein 1-like 1